MDTIYVNKISLSKCDVTINLYHKPSLKLNKKNLKKHTKDNEKLNFVIKEIKSSVNNNNKETETPCNHVKKSNIIEEILEDKEEYIQIRKDELVGKNESEDGMLIIVFIIMNMRH